MTISGIRPQGKMTTIKCKQTHPPSPHFPDSSRGMGSGQWEGLGRDGRKSKVLCGQSHNHPRPHARPSAPSTDPQRSQDFMTGATADPASSHDSATTRRKRTSGRFQRHRSDCLPPSSTTEGGPCSKPGSGDRTPSSLSATAVHAPIE